MAARCRRPSLPGEGAGSAAQHRGRTQHVAIVAALAEVDPDQREVVVLHHLADLGTAEIAAELGVPEGTVKSRLSRGRARLAPLLDEREEPRHA